MEHDSSVFSLTTIGGYALLGGLGVLVYLNYQRNNQGRQGNARAAAGQAGKHVADLGRDVASATAAMTKKAEKSLKQKPKPKAPSSETAPTPSRSYDPEAEAAAKRDEARANQDFAQSFSKLKSGHQFTAQKSEKKKQKSVKQSRAQEADTPVANASSPSSTTGDADDDLSSAASPVVPAADSTGVSDMLEAAAPGPSVLRLTDTDSVKTQQKKAKAPEVVESKKQRQNRLKAERKKLEREQEEAERKKLEEAQRRRARVAEGRPAKDGSAFLANNSPWVAKSNGEKTVQPLDTFEQKPAAESTNLSTPKPAAAATKERSDSWMSSLPSEEEQFAQVLEDSSAWNEVTSKKGKKGKKGLETADAPAAQATPSAAPAPVAKAPVNGGYSKSKPALSSNSSFAALTPEETADEVEEEWEV
ncbi:uncharacterized protein JN550_003277 [Neoarthrinium moseri]|uniref:uncharacterized protein n=1 Tax=Neoarthrinium moseri TaxID=1658444 RepID=UPI001FDBE109|nr:uncharacterized protein JN550_003277 [Neoarthrinium moseri]KAI1873024.1 hypothetical protein JN550_003277 [Neoarthrinium moseri]